MSQADWTPSPIAEREAALLRRRTRWSGLHVWVAGVSVCVAMGSFMWLTRLLGQAFNPGQLAAATTLTLVSAFVTVWAALRDNAVLQEAAAPDRLRREEFGKGEGWLLDLTILQGEAPTGKDHGMLWTESGKLCFSGDRTSFALGLEQLSGPIHSETPIRGLRHSARVPLVHRTNAGPLALSFDVVGGTTPETVRQLCLWAERAPRYEGQLPPTRLGPGAVSSVRLILGAAFATAYWLALLSLIALADGISAALAVLILGVILGMALRCGYLITRWRAWWDLRRVER